MKENNLELRNSPPYCNGCFENVGGETETGYMIHTGRYKYELDDIGKIREMFVDLKIDKGETRNLIDNPRYKKIIASLRSKLTTSLMNRSIPFNPPYITK